MTNDSIKIAIIEDDKTVATGIQSLINDTIGLECKHLYFTGEEAITFLPKVKVDIVLADIGLPDISGIEAMKQLRLGMPHTLFCMFTVFEDNVKIFDSIKAGAKGYILKNSNPETIINSIFELSKGGSPINPLIARKIIQEFNNPVDDKFRKSPFPLSPREIEILQLLEQGKLYKEIATQLGITIGTVKQHVHRIYGKLEVSNRTEALNKFNR
ncbi:MAG: response regulator transcription factor [Bacteroidota bacterium]